MKSYLAEIMAVLALLLIIPLGINNYSLRERLTQSGNDLAITNSNLAIKTAEVNGCQQAVSKQNQGIDALEQMGQRMQDIGNKAQEQAAESIAALKANIAKLKTQNTASCTASGIRTQIMQEVKPDAIDPNDNVVNSPIGLHQGS